MTQKLIIASFQTGYETDMEPFLLGNDAFPVLENAFLWRKRIRKKPGTSLLGRLRRHLEDQSLGNTDGNGDISGNIQTILSLQADMQIRSSTVTITIGAETITDNGSGVLTGSISATGTINYASHVFSITGAPISTAVTITFDYYPCLPVMGLRQFYDNSTEASSINFPDLVAFDTVYSYQWNTSTLLFDDASFYKMNSANPNPFVWSGANYQQFLTINYEDAMWCTNNKSGLHAVTGTYTSGSGTATITLAIPADLQVGDKLFFNEWTGTINQQTGTVASVITPSTSFTVDFTSTVTASGTGMVQLLTQSVSGQDGIKYYDGLGFDKGFVNFSPPLQNTASPTYLVGCRILVGYQNRLLAIGTLEQSFGGSVQYYKDRIRYSQIGTPYYNSQTPTNFNLGNTADAWFDNVGGKGGFLDLDTDERIISAKVIQNDLILGLEKTQRKLTGTAVDSSPFRVETINPDIGNESTHATVSLDRGVLFPGDYGYFITTNYSAGRFDEKIPDQLFSIDNSNNGNDRVSGVRDYYNQFIYYCYPEDNTPNCVFPTESLLYNYLEKNFAVFRENFTSQGLFRKQNTYTWATIGSIYPSWANWSVPWNDVISEARFPVVVGGTPQGFVLEKDRGTFPAQSKYIQSLSGSTIISPNHCLRQDDYIFVQNVESGSFTNSIMQVTSITDSDMFTVDDIYTGSYVGNGTFTLLDQINIQTKIFPLYWKGGFGTRIGNIRFLLDTTTNGEFTADLFVNEDNGTPVNNPALNSWLLANNVVRSKPDANTVLKDQQRLWHRLSNSVTGESVQLGLRYSDSQMRSENIQRAEFTLHAILIEFYQGAMIS